MVDTVDYALWLNIKCKKKVHKYLMNNMASVIFKKMMIVLLKMCRFGTDFTPNATLPFIQAWDQHYRSPLAGDLRSCLKLGIFHTYMC